MGAKATEREMAELPVTVDTEAAATEEAAAARALAEPLLAPGVEKRTRRRGILSRPAERLTMRRDSVRRRSLAAADIVGLLAGYVVALALVGSAASTTAEAALVLVSLPAWVLLHKALGLYDRDAHLVHKSTLNELPKLVQSIALGTALLFLFGPFVPGLMLGRPEALGFLLTAVVAVPGLRYLARMLVNRLAAPERCLIIGTGAVAEVVARKIRAHPEYGAQLVGHLDGSDEHAPEVTDVEALGDIDDFEGVCRRHRVERVVIAFSSLPEQQMLDLVRAAKRQHLKVTIVPRLFEVVGSSVEIDQIEGMTLMGLRAVERTTSTLLLKRGVDIVGATLALLLTAPLLVLVALAVKVTSPGPVLFAQRRVGRDNAEFKIFKFRTMVHGADALKPALIHLNEVADGLMFKIRDDPRMTRVGRLLRRASLDELPQLWNVLRGEMSLVGPRPLVPAENDHVIGWHRARLDLTPGLTGPWQVLGRNSIPFDEMVKLDYLYVAEWSLWNDIKLLVRTLPVVVGRRGS
jgi:exopolysaccharide biosynthesis polyprenyl glycosylphosphotransferase